MARHSTAAERKALPLWVGVKPRVWVGPVATKGGVVYLRWWRGTNWKWKSLGFPLEGLAPAERRAKEAEAYQAALEQYERLTGRKATTALAATAPCRVSDAWALFTYPRPFHRPANRVYRKEIALALAAAAKVWGEDFPWTAFDRARLREVTRRQADLVMGRGGVGFRAAQVVGARLITIARALQDEGYLPAGYTVPGGKSWIPELRTYCETKRGDVIPAPHRPRYTLEEFRALLRVAADIDPRFGLMTALGAELRGGQVARARRSHLDLAAGRLEIHGRGKKKGAVLDLTDGQRAALATAHEGYLRDCEAAFQQRGEDYVLFPSRLGAGQRAVPGHLAVVDKEQLKKWVQRAEGAAGIVHVRGRSWYGSRRVAVDAALDAGASTEELQAFGGWDSRRMADETYSDRQRETVRVATKALRARVRGETPVAPAAEAGAPSLRDRLSALEVELRTLANTTPLAADAIGRELLSIAQRLTALLPEVPADA